MALISCQECGSQVSDVANKCPKCGCPTTSNSSSGHGGLIAAGYICGFASLLILPPALGAVGVVCGILLLTKGNTANGIAILVISVTCGLFGMIIGAAMMSQ